MEISDYFIGFLSETPTENNIKVNGQTLKSSDYEYMYKNLLKMKELFPDNFEKSEDAYKKHIEDEGFNYKFYIDEDKIICPKYKTKELYITYTNNLGV